MSPCKDCQERHTACHGHCPKDARGEYGYEAWKAEMDAMNAALKRQKDTGWTSASLKRQFAYIKLSHSGFQNKYPS